MGKGNVTLILAEYIQQNQISISQIAKDTGISEDKLHAKSTEKLNATEFLTLCSYLGIKPEELKNAAL